MWAEVEAATGKEVPRDVISAADLEARIAKLRIAAAADPTSVGPLLDLAMSQYRHSRHVRGDNVPDRARYLGYLDGKTLYPDLKCTSLRDFIRDVADGKRDHRISVGRDVVADATQHRARHSWEKGSRKALLQVEQASTTSTQGRIAPESSGPRYQKIEKTNTRGSPKMQAGGHQRQDCKFVAPHGPHPTSCCCGDLSNLSPPCRHDAGMSAGYLMDASN